jgi:hypothetical protein
MHVRRVGAWWQIAVVAIGIVASSIGAQQPTIDIRPPASTRDAAPIVRFSQLLDSATVGDLLRNGFPLRLHSRAELWSLGRLFNALDDKVEWDVIVRYDQLSRIYTVTRVADGRPAVLGEFTQLGDAILATSLPFRPPLRAPQRGRRSYYAVQVDVEALSLSDLDELQRWLRGELSPAGAAPEGGSSGFGRGMRAMVTRILGGDVRRYEARTSPIGY